MWVYRQTEINKLIWTDQISFLAIQKDSFRIHRDMKLCSYGGPMIFTENFIYIYYNFSLDSLYPLKGPCPACFQLGNHFFRSSSLSLQLLVF